MKWAYVILEHRDEEGEASYAVHEVYFDDNDVPVLCTEDPVKLDGFENNIEIIKELFYMGSSILKHPIMSYDAFVNKGLKNDEEDVHVQTTS